MDALIPIGLVISALAGLAAFLITYEEWSHHYASNREPIRHGIEAAIVAFLVFTSLMVVSMHLVDLIIEH